MAAICTPSHRYTDFFFSSGFCFCSVFLLQLLVFDFVYVFLIKVTTPQPSSVFFSAYPLYLYKNQDTLLLNLNTQIGGKWFIG